MKKIIALLTVMSIVAGIVVTIQAVFFMQTRRQSPISHKAPGATQRAETPQGNLALFDVYIDNRLHEQFNTYESALAFAQKNKNAAIKESGRIAWLWDNFQPYNVFLDNEQTYESFDTFAQAAALARTKERAFIYYRKDNNLIWSSIEQPKEAVRIETVPLILQRPELPRGCEVTSLAMLVQFYGKNIDKMTLAQEVPKDPTPFQVKNGHVFWGNPNTGFVGDMYGAQNKGFGVYHKPIHTLLTVYFPYAALDLTGCEFTDIMHFLNSDTPVWVIVNTTYAAQSPTSFHTIETPTGQVDITYQEHAVVVTGYDGQNVYFNDPLGAASSAPFDAFVAAWVQMGSQAVAVSN